jgi:hypothetical protein
MVDETASATGATAMKAKSPSAKASKELNKDSIGKFWWSQTESNRRPLQCHLPQALDL